jgi:hypothetical protein
MSREKKRKRRINKETLENIRRGKKIKINRPPWGSNPRPQG